jgi:hypothetical protein
MQKIQVIGKKFKANFGGEFVFQLDFHSDTEMTYAPLLENGLGALKTVRTTMVEIRPNVYMVYWKEISNTTVVHVEDFENGVAHTNITVDKDTFLNFSGTLTEIN